MSVGPGVRLTDLLAALSFVIDLGMGHPHEHVLRQTHLALRLAEAIGLDELDREVVFYASVLAWVGCHVDSYEQARWFGDEQALKHDARFVDIDRPLSSIPFVLGRLAAGRPFLDRARVGIGFLGEGQRQLRDLYDNHWRATSTLAQDLGLPAPVLDSVAQTFERWDGRGVPEGLRGSDVVPSSRLVMLADVVDVFHQAGGVAAAVAVARARSGTQFDPDLVDLFCRQAGSLLGELAAVDGWPDVLRFEPRIDRRLSADELDRVLAALGDFVDLKSPYTLGHTRRVAALAGAAAEELGLDARLVRRAGWLHDLGRYGVPSAIWDKPGRLAAAERERVRLHPYYTARMLDAVPGLAAEAAVAAQHHERLDGSGYPRGSTGAVLGPEARLLAAADCLQARSEPRPHRRAGSPAEVAVRLRDEVRAGRLDGGAVEAVLTAAGHRTRSRREWPAGLTTREVEVLRLLVQGLTHREIADRLVISRRTAAHHVEHIYAKIGVSNRAMACLFATRHGLLPP